MKIRSGDATRRIYFLAVDETDLRTPETGLSSFTVVRSRDGGTPATYTSPTVAELNSSSMPGIYSLLVDEDVTIDAGVDEQEVMLVITHTGMAPVRRTFTLYRSKITAGNTLDVTANGNAGIDWGNVDNATSSVALSNTTVGLINSAITSAKFATDALSAAAVSDAAAVKISTAFLIEDPSGYIGASTFGELLNDLFTLASADGVAINWAAIQNPTATKAFTNTTLGLLDDAITAAKIATDAITAAKVAADVSAEIADAVLDEALAGHVTAGSLSKAISDTSNAVLTTGVTIADGALTAAKFATDAITASKLAADAVTEIVTGVWSQVVENDGATIIAKDALAILMATEGGCKLDVGSAVAGVIIAYAPDGTTERYRCVVNRTGNPTYNFPS